MEYAKVLLVLSTWVSGDLSSPDIALLHLQGDFESQVEYVLQSVKSDVNVTAICRDLEIALQDSWPECKVKPYGSLAAGLGTTWSDVDCFVQAPSSHPSQELVGQMRQMLVAHPHVFTALETVTTTRVPKLKCIHIPTGKECDVTLTKPAAVRNTRLVAYLLKLDRRASQLAYIIKYWSHRHRLTGLLLMPSYTMSLMVIFYLQLHHILPAVYQLQTNDHIVENWNTAIDTRLYYRTNNTESVYQLLGGFFKYYSNFNFDKYIVAPYTGRPEDKCLFGNVLDVPEDYGLYKYNVRMNRSAEFNVRCNICVQDPFVHARNQAGAVCPELAQKIILLFRLAAKMYAETTSQHFLTSILKTRYRKKIICQHIAGNDLG